MEIKSRRARRMERHHKMHKASPLNLVSLMDIFTILVFFLLVNSSNAPELPSHKDVKLPKSTAQAAPSETPIVAVTQDAVLVQGRRVASFSELAGSDAEVFEPLAAGLRELRANRRGEAPGADAITIMADSDLAFGVLSRILATCRAENFTEIAFAARQAPRPQP